MRKSITSAVLAVCILLSANSVFALSTYNYTTKEELYLDEEGMSEERIEDYKSARRSEGFIPEDEIPAEDWVTLYSADGRTMKTVYFLVDTYKNLGWYTENLVTLYAKGGRSESFPKSEVEAQKTVGWYEEPLVVMYAFGGKVEEFVQSEVEAQKTVGWYTEPIVTMYARDGRTAEFFQHEVEAQKTVGWYVEPFVTMYTIDGKTELFQPNEVSAQKKVGWYDSEISAKLARETRDEELQKNIEASKKFYVGAKVMGSVFAYSWYGTVKDVRNGQVLVNWDSFYDSYDFKITNRFEIINLEYALGVYLNEPTWYEASKVYFLE